MVKRLRRRPLTAESGVRVPLGVPKKYKAFCLVFLCLPGESARALGVRIAHTRTVLACARYIR